MNRDCLLLEITTVVQKLGIWFALLIISSASLANQCVGIFDHAIQSHNQGVSISENVTIEHLSSTIPSPLISQNQDLVSCGGEQCQASGQASQSLLLPPFLFSTNIQNNVISDPLQPATLIAGEVEYGQILVSSNSTLEFNDQIPIRIIDHLVLEPNSHLIIPQGDYWIRKLELGIGSRISLSDEGSSRLFIKDNLLISDFSSILTFGKDNLLLIGYENIVLSGNNEIQASIYSQGQLILGSNSNVTGRNTADYLELQSIVNIAESQVDSQALEGLCSDFGPLADTDGDGWPDGIDPDQDNNGVYDFVDNVINLEPESGTDIQSTSLSTLSTYDDSDANACLGTFSNGIQSHGLSGLISFGQNSQLLNSSSLGLYANQIDRKPKSQYGHCDGSDCYSLNENSSPLPLRNFVSVSGTEVLTIKKNDLAELSASDSNRYANIRVDGNAMLTVAITEQQFIAGDVWIKSGATLQLTAGDYWFNSLSIDSKSSLSVIGEGTARVYVKENIEVLPFGLINSDEGMASKPEQLLLVSGSIDIGNKAEVSALISTEGLFQNKGTVYGAISADEISLQPQSTVRYAPLSVWSLDFSTHCDIDSDGQYDLFDLDRDGDGINNEYEKQLGFNPNDAHDTPPDLDADGIPDALDTDRDGDGVQNQDDVFPDDANEWADLDQDGIGDNSDTDRDGDGFENDDELSSETDPNDATDHPDRIKPTVTVNAESQLTNQATVNISVTAADEYSGLKSLVLENSLTGQVIALDYLASNDVKAIVPLAEGQNILIVTATDNWDNAQSAEVIVNRDSIAPVIERLTPLELQSTNNSIQLSYTVLEQGSGIARFSVSSHGIDLNVATNDGNYSSQATLSEGETEFVAITVDLAGNIANDTFTYLADFTPPIISNIQIPAIVNDDKFIISFEVTDNLSGVPIVTLKHNNLDVLLQQTGIDSGLMLSAELTLSGGVNELQILTADGVGNQSNQNAAINADFTAPVISLNEYGDYWQTSPDFTLAGTIIDENSGIESAQWSQLNSSTTLSLINNGFELYTLLAEGENSIEITAIDAAGNPVSKILDIALDTTAPVLLLEQPLNIDTNESSLRLTGQAQDVGSGISALTLLDQTANVSYPVNITNGLYSFDWNLAEGAQQAILVLTDNVGHETSLNLNVRADHSAPQFTNQQFPTLVNESQTEISFEVTDSYLGLNQIQLSNNNIDIAFSQTQIDNGFLITANLDLKEGVNQIALFANDVVGNETTEFHTINVDSVAPVVSIQEPATYWQSDSGYLFAGTVADNDSGLNNIEFNHSGVTTPLEVQNNAFSFNVSLVEGDNTLAVFAIDKAGNQTTESISVGLDTTQPTLVINQSTDVLTNSTSILISGNAADSGSGIAKLELIDHTQATTVLVSMENGQFAIDWALIEGEQSASLVLTDHVGLKASWSLNVHTDFTAPELSNLQLPQIANSSTIDFSVDVTDTGLGLDGLTVMLNNNLVQTLDTPITNGLNAFASLNLLEGNNNLQISATDSVGNTTIVTKLINLDTAAPVVLINEPVNYWQTVAPFAVSGTITDENSGIATSTILFEQLKSALALSDNVFYAEITLLEGDNSILVQAKDLADNETQSELTLGLDTTPPVLQLDQERIVSTNASSLKLTGEVSDSGSGINSLFLVNEATNTSQEITLVNGQYDFDWVLEEGDQTGILVLKDQVGHETSISINVKADYTAPELMNWQVPVLSNIQNISASVEVTDELSGIGSIQVLLNNQDIAFSQTPITDGFLVDIELNLNEGQNQLEFIVSDAVGNQVTQTIQINVDFTAPVINLNPFGDYWQTSPDIKLTGTIIDENSGIESAQWSQLNSSVTLNLVNNGFELNALLIEGENSLEITAIDAAGNPVSKILEVGLDTTAPELLLEQPLSVDTNETSLRLSGQVQDIGSGIASLTLLDQTVSVSYPVNITDGLFTIDWALAEGAQHATLVLKDNVGHETSLNLNVRADHSAPQFTNQQFPTLVNESQTEISFEVTDSYLGLNQIQLSNNNSDITFNQTPIENGFLINAILDLQEGVNQIVLLANDVVGNEVTELHTISVDIVAPVVVIQDPTSYWQSESNYVLSGTVTDYDSGINNVEFIQFGLSTSLELLNDSLSFATSLVEGDNLLAVTATDKAGNQTTESISVGLDTIQPTLVVNQNANVFTNSASYLISGNGADSGSGIASFELIDNTQGASTSVPIENGQFAIDWPLTEGEQTASLVLIDYVGLKTIWNLTVHADFTAPILSNWQLPLLANSRTIEFAVDVTDTGLGLDGLTVLLNNNLIQTQNTPIANGLNVLATLNLLEGDNNLQISATDLVGNTTSVTKLINLDTAAPVVLFHEPDNYWQTAAPFTVSGTITDENSGIATSSITFEQLTSSLSLIDNAFGLDITLSEGHNSILVQTKDLAGNENQAELTVGLDTTPPVLTLDQEQNVSTNAPSLNLTGNVSDSGSGIESLTLVNEATNTSQEISIVNGRYNFNWAIEEGEQTGILVLKDQVGHETSISINVKADYTAPNFLNWQVPLLTNTQNINASVEVTDEFSGIGSIQVLQNNQDIAFGQSPIVNGLLLDIELNLTEGQNQLEFIVSDTVGNQATQTLQINVDLQSPAITLNQPNNYWQNASGYLVTGSVTDENSGVNKASLSIAGTQSALTLESDTFSEAIDLVEGDNKVTVFAEDNAGNQSSNDLLVGLDTIAPVLSVDQNQAQVTNNAIMTISGQVSDASSGINQLILRDLNNNTEQTVVVTGGQFSVDWLLSAGTQEGLLVLTDNVGLETSKNLSVLADFTGPEIQVSLSDGTLTNQAAQLVSITISDESSGITAQQALLNDIAVALPSTDTTINIQLQEGQNTFVVTATDVAGNKTTATYLWVLDTQAPVINWTSPNAASSVFEYLAKASITDASELISTSLLINGQQRQLGAGNNNIIESVTLQEGDNSLVIATEDAAGNTAESELSIQLDTLVPIISLDYLPEVVNTSSILVSGQITDSSEVNLTINNMPVQLDGLAKFSEPLNLNVGPNDLVIVATDSLGNSRELVRSLVSDQIGPQFSWNAPAITDQELVQITGTIEDDFSDISSLTIINEKLGVSFTAQITGNQFDIQVALEPSVNQLTIIAKDSVNNETINNLSIELITSRLEWSWLSTQYNETTAESPIVLEGLLSTDATLSEISASINGQTASISLWDTEQYSVRSVPVNLVEGENIIAVHIQTPEDELQETIRIYYEPDQSGNESEADSNLELSVASPANNSQIMSEWLVVSGEINSSSTPQLLINGSPVQLSSSAPYYHFSQTLLVPDGVTEFSVAIQVSNEQGLKQTETRTVFVDKSGPQVTIDQPLLDYPQVNNVLEDPFIISGRISDSNLGSVTINGQTLSLQPEGNNSYSFSQPLTLPVGAEAVVDLQANDLAGNSTNRSWLLKSVRSIGLEWLLPVDNSEFITYGDPFSVQVVLQTDDKLGTNSYQMRLVDKTSGQAGSWQLLSNSNGVISDNLQFSGIAGLFQIEARGVNSSNQVVVSTSPRSIKVNEQVTVPLALISTVPVNGADNVDSKESIAVFFNQAIDPQKLGINVFETAHGKTWINLDQPGTEFFRAKGHQLVDVARSYDPVPGTVRVLPSLDGFIFQPTREPAANAQIFVEVNYDGESLNRLSYTTKKLPTLVSFNLKDQFNQNVDGIRVRLGELEAVSQEGYVSFGFGNNTTEMASGDYQLWINPNMLNAKYGETKLTIPVQGSRHNELGNLPVSFLNPETGASFLVTGEVNSLLGNAVSLDLTGANLDFPNNAPDGVAHVQFNVFGSYNYPTHPMLAPAWLYSFQPLGIKVIGEPGLSIELPKRLNSYDYLPDEGSLGLFIGLNSQTETIEPIGIVERQGNRAVVIGSHKLDVLDHIGVTFLGTRFGPILQQYRDGQLSLQLLMAKITEVSKSAVNENE